MQGGERRFSTTTYFDGSVPNQVEDNIIQSSQKERIRARHRLWVSRCCQSFQRTQEATVVLLCRLQDAFLGVSLTSSPAAFILKWSRASAACVGVGLHERTKPQPMRTSTKPPIEGTFSVGKQRTCMPRNQRARSSVPTFRSG